MQAALVVGQQQFNSGNVLPSPIIAVSGDLLQTSVSLATGENSSALVRNGTTGTAHNNAAPNPANTWNNTVTTYDLNVSINTAGYSISEIRLFSGWSDARASQAYQLSYSIVGSASFTNLGGPVFASVTNGSLLTRTFDTLGAPILSGVDAIRITQSNINVGSGIIAGTGTVFREFDVLGMPTEIVPEPGSLTVLLCGSVGLLWLRRKK